MGGGGLAQMRMGQVMAEFLIPARRGGKTLVAVNASKAAQRQGKTMLWATNDQTATGALLAKHGALSEVIGRHHLKPRFKKG